MHIELRMTTMLSQLVHKAKRWRLNIKVKERALHRGKQGFKHVLELFIYKREKSAYLISLF